MRNMTTIMRRELGAYFNSPIAYVVISVFLVLSAFLFFNALFLQQQADLRELFDGFWTTLLVAILGPAITMRLFAEERSNDTLELLLTMPVTDWDVVLGKYLAALVLFGYAMLAMLCFAVSVSLLGPLDKGAAFAGFAGLYLTTATYMAIGLMASAFTKNQIVAFLLAVTLCLLLWLVGKVVQVMPPAIQPFV
ncbi:MAG TPA: ABC transporter permease subunit, partial [Pseudomonadota bacterium]|nr:ABC transporter permease subunit [Pseudomonadota bacterium]